MLKTLTECEGCPGSGTTATRLYHDAVGADVHYCDDCGDLAECGWNGRAYTRVQNEARPIPRTVSPDATEDTRFQGD